VRVKAVAKHARPAGVSPWAAWLRAGFPGTWHHGAPGPAAAPGPVRGDPLTGPIAITERPVLGDQIRRPIVWCEIAPCIGRYEDPAALGEADIRARALSAGWRADGLGRLTCPQCQQSSPLFWSAHPVALWDKEAALITVARMAAGRRESRAGRDAGTAESGVLPPVQAAITVPGRHEIRGRHRKYSQRSPANVPGGEDIAALPVTVT